MFRRGIRFFDLSSVLHHGSFMEEFMKSNRMGEEVDVVEAVQLGGLTAHYHVPCAVQLQARASD